MGGNMMVGKLRVGLIGCGAIAQIMHIPYLVDYDEKFELVAISDIHQPTLDAVGEHYHVAKRFSNWRDLMARDDVDAVVICHNGSHRDTVMAALDAGKHVFVEKPLAWNLREVEEVAARAAKSDQVVQLGYHKLYDPGFVYAKEQVEKMRDLGFVRITVLHPANELGLSPHRIRRGDGVISEGHVDVGTWEGQRQGQLHAFAGNDLAPLVDEVLGTRKGHDSLRLGYGVMVSSLIHQVYTLYGFLGRPTRVLSAHVWRDGFSIHAMVEYPNDVRCTLDWHFLSHLKDYREEYAFYGNHDRVLMQLPSPYFKNFPSPVIVQGYEGELAWEKRIIVNYEEAFRNEMLAFYDNVQTKRQPLYGSLDDVVQHSRFIQQLINAAGD
jgi:predicted dehydrogenase